MTLRFMLFILALLLVNFSIAQDNNDLDCGDTYRYEHLDLELLSEEKLASISNMRSVPPLYHNNGVGFQAVRKNLDGLDFSNLAFPYAQFLLSSFQDANLEKARASGAIFAEANLQSVNLKKIAAHNANFDNANLCMANLTRAGLLGASFTGANLRSSNLSFANLSMTNLVGADLTDADLTGAALVGAILDSRTITIEQLSKAASLHNIVLVKNNDSGGGLGPPTFIAPLAPYSIDTDMQSMLMQTYPDLFEPIDLNWWFSRY